SSEIETIIAGIIRGVVHRRSLIDYRLDLGSTTLLAGASFPSSPRELSHCIMIGQAVIAEAEPKGPLSFPNGKVEIRLWRTRPDRRTLLAGLLVFAGYFLGVKLGLALTFRPHPVSVMWPPNSILLAALLLTPPRTWWFLLLCALPAHLLAELQSLVPLKMVL